MGYNIQGSEGERSGGGGGGGGGGVGGGVGSSSEPGHSKGAVPADLLKVAFKQSSHVVPDDAYEQVFRRKGVPGEWGGFQLFGVVL
jgi:hypothetical protein